MWYGNNFFFQVLFIVGNSEWFFDIFTENFELLIHGGGGLICDHVLSNYQILSVHTLIQVT